jgi:site-specific DNA-cytosine methylase
VVLVQAGVQIISQVEIAEGVRKVLDERFPHVDKPFNVKHLRAIPCHIDFCSITFPCNATSLAGPRTGMRLTHIANKVMHKPLFLHAPVNVNVHHMFLGSQDYLN